MDARRAKGDAMRSHDLTARELAREAVDRAKHALGERGPAWWTDGAPDYNRHMVQNTPYAKWYQGLSSATPTLAPRAAAPPAPPPSVNPASSASRTPKP
jgi:hypothetical protein